MVGDGFSLVEVVKMEISGFNRQLGGELITGLFKGDARERERSHRHFSKWVYGAFLHWSEEHRYRKRYRCVRKI